jgi:hypothetical protein
VWSTQTGQRTWTAPQPHHISPRRDFGGETEIVEVTAKNIWIWDFRNHRKVREIEAATSSVGLPHYSPTRKYLVRPESNGLRIYDLTDGDLVGHLAFPEFVGLELKLADLDWSDDAVVEPPRKLIEQRVASLRAGPKRSFIDAKKEDVYDAVDWGAVHARADRLTLLRMHGTQEELPVIEKLIANDPNPGIRLQAKSTADRIRQSNR